MKTTALFVAILLVMSVTPTWAQLTPPHVLIGTATIYRMVPPDGTEVLALDGDRVLGRATTEGGKFTLQVERPTGAVAFTVGGAPAPATFRWQMGQIQRGFRLSAVSSLIGTVSTEQLSLALGGRLVVVFAFDNASKTWSFWDGKEGSNLMEISPGKPYWIQVSESIIISLNGRVKDLSCGTGNCWNQLVS